MAEGLGEGCVKIMLIVSCLEWLICLVLIVMVEFKSYYTAVTVLIFLVTKVCQKGTMFHSYEILCYALVGDKVLW